MSQICSKSQSLIMRDFTVHVFQRYYLSSILMKLFVLKHFLTSFTSLKWRERQFTCNAIFLRVRVATLHTTTHLVRRWAACECPLRKNITCCTTMLLWWIYVPINNKACVGLHVKGPSCNEAKNILLLARGLLQMYSLATQILMTEKSLRSFSVSVRVAVRHCTRSDENNELSRNWY